MAENKSFLKFKGTVGDLCFYKLNGKDIVRKATGPSASRIKYDPAFANVKKNNHEFAGATYISKSIRRAWGAWGKQFQETYVASYLTGECRHLIAAGKGTLGQREGNLRINGNILIGFPLNRAQPASKYVTPNWQITHSPDRGQITISNTNSSIKLPKAKAATATHIEITAAIAWVANHHWTEATLKYQPTNPVQNSMGATQTTGFIAITQWRDPMVLQLDIPQSQIPTADVALVIGLSVQFGREENNAITALKTGQSAQIIAVI
ncbi:hypothetical protein [Ulvibacter antarcticus]|uniref:Uncharacterized protein n=1 Tax=Ulvibacter antarcticus TaxID=442714 RepID=A0A3L9YWW3_9FLAO|nr:hypothetical protein [Ulvibacter antarcticus]RMA64317.1 hypothetical protein BXY75_1190 [Ulvibacter antarcticus]